MLAAIPFRRQRGARRTNKRAMTAAMIIRVVRTLLIAPAALAAACASVPRGEAAPTAAFAIAAPIGFSPSVRSLGFERRIAGDAPERNVVRLRAAADDGSLDILALSGGGANGAFAAGFLVELGERGVRPQYEVVTGVSAGALIAPFAFLGPDWDPELRNAFLGGASEGLLRSRGVGVLFWPGVNSGEPLRELVETIVTDALIEAVAREAARGRILLVATTDLDRQEPVLWDLGAIAAQGGEQARALFRDVIVASASVPGLFPPVIIEVSAAGALHDEMHVDGGAATPFFFAPAIAYFDADPIDGLAGANVFVLISGPLRAPTRTTPQATIPILSRSFSTLMMHMTRTAIAATSAYAARQGMGFHLAAMPPETAEEDWLDFRREHLASVFAIGARRAAGERPWLDAEAALASAAQ